MMTGRKRSWPLAGGVDHPEAHHPFSGKLDNKDAVLGRQPESGDEPDLKVDIIGKTP
jgi:hypothetical protein